MKAVVRFAALFISLYAYGQSDTEFGVHRVPRYDSAREQYIRSYPDHFFIWPVIKQRKLDFRIDDVPSNGRPITFNPNRPYALGLGVYLFEVGLELAAALPVSERSEYIFGRSRGTDLQLNVFGKKWGVDLYRQKYQGYYITDPNIQVPPNTPYLQRPDIYTRNLYVTTSYTFNNQRFSQRSAYNYIETQLRSSGSFLLYGLVNGFKARGDSAILGPAYQTAYGVDARIMRVNSIHLGAAPGYSYSLIHKGFFINALLAVGPAYNWLRYSTDDGQSVREGRLATFFLARFALGYNGDRFFTGMSIGAQTANARFDAVRLSSSTQMLRIVFGFRIREFGILRHRVTDVPDILGLNL